MSLYENVHVHIHVSVCVCVRVSVQVVCVDGIQNALPSSDTCLLSTVLSFVDMQENTITRAPFSRDLQREKKRKRIKHEQRNQKIKSHMEK